MLIYVYMIVTLTAVQYAYYLFLVLKKIKKNNAAGKDEKCLFQILN